MFVQLHPTRLDRPALAQPFLALATGARVERGPTCTRGVFARCIMVSLRNHVHCRAAGRLPRARHQQSRCTGVAWPPARGRHRLGLSAPERGCDTVQNPSTCAFSYQRSSNGRKVLNYRNSVPCDCFPSTVLDSAPRTRDFFFQHASRFQTHSRPNFRR